MELIIRDVSDEGDLERVAEFMRQSEHGKFYQGYDGWLEGVCLPGIGVNRKALFAIEGGEVVGDVVYRPKGDGIEVKHLRIDKDYRHRDLGRFLLKQVERETDGGLIVLDTTAKNIPAVNFYFAVGFKAVDAKELYVPGQTELLMERRQMAA